MDNIDRTKPLLILIAYVSAALAAVIVWRFLGPFHLDLLAPWIPFGRFLTGISDFIGLFPALSLSAIVLSYAGADERLRFERFSILFWERSLPRLVAVLVAAFVYSGLSLLALPAAKDNLMNMVMKTSLFRSAMSKAMTEVAVDHWPEAARSMAICESIWPNSPETDQLRDALAVNYSPFRQLSRANPSHQQSAGFSQTSAMAVPTLPGERPAFTVLEALETAQRKLAQGAVYDAHWAAQLARQLAPADSSERKEADRLASTAWNAIEDLQPNPEATAAYDLFKRKRIAYTEAVSGNWLAAYYHFLMLSTLDPDDPDNRRYLELSRTGVQSLAFFTDELTSGQGSLEQNAVLSLPGEDGGRIVMRAAHLQLFPDFIYADGLELLALRPDLTIDFHVTAAYAKFLPSQFDNKTTPVTNALLRAIDRNDETRRWEPRRIDQAGAAFEPVLQLPFAFSDFLLAARALRGSESLNIRELWLASNSLDSFGYTTTTFQAETLRRLSEPFFFCVLAMWVLTYAWRLRPNKRPGLLFLPMMLLLPFVLDLLVQSFRVLTAGILVYVALSLPFTIAVAAVLAFEAVLLVVALVFFAGQRT